MSKSNWGPAQGRNWDPAQKPDVVDTIARTAARLAKPPSRERQRAEIESITAQELATIARVRAESCSACSAHEAAHLVPCLKHTPHSLRRARARAIGAVR